MPYYTLDGSQFWMPIRGYGSLPPGPLPPYLEPASTPSSKPPSQLLDLNNSPKFMKGFAATNSSKSSFLKLPPEIRSRIYVFLLEGYTIHFQTEIMWSRYDPRSNTLFTCNSPEDYDAATDKWRRIAQRYLPKTPRTKTHSYCEAPLQQSMQISPLTVCRQVYHEAALVPFTNNRFAFGSNQDREGEVLEVFLDRLVPTQVRAIKRLILETSDRCGPFPRTTLLRLTGVKSLQIHILVASDPALTLEQRLIRTYSEFDILRALPLISAKMSVCVLTTHGEPPAEIPEAASKWRLETERKLLELPGQLPENGLKHTVGDNGQGIRDEMLEENGVDKRRVLVR